MSKCLATALRFQIRIFERNSNGFIQPVGCVGSVLTGARARHDMATEKVMPDLMGQDIVGRLRNRDGSVGKSPWIDRQPLRRCVSPTPLGMPAVDDEEAYSSDPKYIPRPTLNRAPYFGGTIHITRGNSQVAKVCWGQPKTARFTGQWVAHQG